MCACTCHRAHAAQPLGLGLCVHDGLHLCTLCTGQRVQGNFLFVRKFLPSCTRCTNCRVQ
jgi:hypothetical protein